MTDRPRSLLRLLLAALTAVALVAACSGSGDDDADADADAEGTGASTPEGPWTFTDDFDVTHELDEVPDTVVAEVSIAGALWDLGYTVDATFGQRELPDGTTDPLGLADPDAMESLGEEYGKVDTERLRLLEPDVIVVPSYLEGQYWGLEDAIVDEVEATAPVVAITIPGRDMRGMADRIAELAETLGADLGSEQVTAAKDAFDASEDALRQAFADHPGVSFMAASGTADSLYVAVPSGYADLTTYQALGMDIVEPDTDETHWQQLSWEQIDTYRADVVLGDSRGGRVDQIFELIPAAAREIAGLEVDQIARWEAVFAPGYANMARIMDDLAEVVETADPDVVP